MSDRKIVDNLKRYALERVRNKDFYLGLTVGLFSLALLLWLIPSHVGSQPTPGIQPTFFPNLIAIVLGILSVLLIIKSPRMGRDQSRVEEKKLSISIVICVGLIFGYLLCIYLIGIIPASILGLIALMKAFGLKSKLFCVIFSIIFTFALYCFFELVAHVPLPVGILFES